jgi:cytochrome c peroxidase
MVLLGLLVWSCDPDQPEVLVGDLTHITYAPKPYTINVPVGFPQLEIPADNPVTMEGMELGRRLFYDPILSLDSTISCASCHLQAGSFTDNLRVSPGVGEKLGRRSAMSLLNIGFYQNGFFWDGRSASLEDQALHPVEDPVEMQEDWLSVERKIQQHQSYPEAFRKAFGINNKSEITRDLVVKSIAQFERIIISSGNSRFDRFLRGEIFFEDDELNGFDMFFDSSPDLPDAECGHCHNAPLFTTNEYFNNGIEIVSSLEGFPDPGMGAVTGNKFDNGTFRVPSLINIEFTAPYMHDGRFETLEEVIDHYNSGGFKAENTNPLIRPLGLTDLQKEDLLAFLKTLSDTSILTTEKLSNPFR